MARRYRLLEVQMQTNRPVLERRCLGCSETDMNSCECNSRSVRPQHRGGVEVAPLKLSSTRKSKETSALRCAKLSRVMAMTTLLLSQLLPVAEGQVESHTHRQMMMFRPCAHIPYAPYFHSNRKGSAQSVVMLTLFWNSEHE